MAVYLMEIVMADKILRQKLIKMLTQETAHIPFERVVDEIPIENRGKRLPGFDHTPWELLEHIRIDVWDILEFSRDPNFKSPPFPEGYWPETEAPPDDNAWDKSVADTNEYIRQLCDVISDESIDLTIPFPHGTGQSWMTSAVLVIQHNAYHIGQLAMMR
jgi:hypothetical protein